MRDRRQTMPYALVAPLVPIPSLLLFGEDGTGADEAARYFVVAMPPSTGMTAPVTYAPARLAR